MKKGHFKINLVVICLLMLTLFVACNNNSIPPHEHVYEEAWSHDDNQHWKKATCEHTEEKGELGDHNWVDNKVITQATTESDGEKEQECSVCGKKRNVTIPKVASLELLDGFIANKTYDKNPIRIDKTKIRRIGSTDPVIEEEIKSILYKQQTEGEYKEQAPSNAGKYTVKVTTVATADHKESEITKYFEISAKTLEGTVSSSNTSDYKGEEVIVSTLSIDDTSLGIISGDKIIFSNIKFTKDAGKDKEAVSYEYDNKNYSVNPSTFKITATINPKEIKTPINATKVYDGNTALVYEKDNWNSVREIEEIDKSSLKLTLTLENENVGNPKVITNHLSSNNYKLANDIVITAEITKKKLNLSKIPTIRYDGSTNYIMVQTSDIIGIVSPDKPKITVMMDSNDVGAKFTNATVVSSSGGNESKNYEVDKTDEKLNKANITKKPINLPSFNVPATSSNSKQRSFVLGSSHGITPTSDTIVVKYKNENSNWQAGYYFQTKTGEITNIDEIKNYTINMPDDSIIKIISANGHIGTIQFKEKSEAKPISITISSKDYVMQFDAMNINTTNSPRNYIKLVKKGSTGYEELNYNNMTGVSGEEKILYLHPSYSKGTCLFDCKNNFASFYLYNLDPGDYELLLYLENV